MALTWVLLSYEASKANVTGVTFGADTELTRREVVLMLNSCACSSFDRQGIRSITRDILMIPQLMSFLHTVHHPFYILSFPGATASLSMPLQAPGPSFAGALSFAGKNMLVSSFK